MVELVAPSLVHGLAISASELVPAGIRCETRGGQAVRFALLAAPFVDASIEGLILNPADIEALKEATHDR